MNFGDSGEGAYVFGIDFDHGCEFVDSGGKASVGIALHYASFGDIILNPFFEYSAQLQRQDPPSSDMNLS